MTDDLVTDDLVSDDLVTNLGAAGLVRSSFNRLVGLGTAGALRGVLFRYSLMSAFVKIIGFSRTAAIAALVGTGAHLDAYYATQVIVSIVVVTFADQFEMVVGQRVRFAKDTNGDAGVRQTASRLFALSMTLGAVCAVGYLCVYPLMYRFLANPGAVISTNEYAKLAFMFLPFVATYLPYRTVCALLKGAGHYNTSFKLDAAQAIAYFALTIAFLTLAGDSPSSAVLAVSSAQVAAQFVLLAIALFVARRFLTHEAWRPRLENVREFLGETSALYLFSLLFFGFTLLDRHFAAAALVGGLSLFSLASTISNTVRSIFSFEQVFGVEFGTAGNRQDILSRAVRTSLRVALPAAVIQAVFAYELMRVAFQRGRFSEQNAARGAVVLMAFGIATVVFMMWPIILRILQAMGGLREVFKLLPVALATALVSGLILVPRIGLSGAVAATGIGQVVLVGGGMLMLRKFNLQALYLEDVVTTVLRATVLVASSLVFRSLVIRSDWLVIRLGVAVGLVLIVDAVVVLVLNSSTFHLRRSPKLS